jgi:hypothetical protein
MIAVASWFDDAGALDLWPGIMEGAEMKLPYTPEVLGVIEKGVQRLPDLPTN